MNVNQTSGTVIALPVTRITIWNFCKLDSLLTANADGWSWRAAAQLAQKLKQAVVMDDDQIPFNVATMQSRIEYRMDGAGLSQIATLVYPGENHLHEDAISVLTPPGAAMLGLSERQSVSYAGPDGTATNVTILRILHQPEAERRRSTAQVREPLASLQLEVV